MYHLGSAIYWKWDDFGLNNQFVLKSTSLVQPSPQLEAIPDKSIYIRKLEVKVCGNIKSPDSSLVVGDGKKKQFAGRSVHMQEAPKGGDHI